MSREYDVIIIGAGHNSLTCGCYLAHAGLKVLIVERRLEFGGGLCTEEVTLPGFYHNLHSNFHGAIPYMPPYFDFDLPSRGVHYYHPDANLGMPLKDGRALIIYVNDKKTYDNFAKFSKKDAELWMEMRRLSYKYINEGLAAAYSPPPDSPELWEVMREDQKQFPRYDPAVVEESAYERILKEFENPHIQALCMFHVAIAGVDIRLKGTAELGMGLLGQANNWQLCRGGSHQLGHALGAVFLEKGGDLLEAMPVKKIIVKSGRAVGVECADGTQFFAKHAVISGVDPHQTIIDFLGEDVAGRELRDKVKSIEYGHGDVLFGVHLALNEPARYACADNFPDVNNLLNVNIGYETPEDLIEHYEEIERGEVPKKPRLNVSCNTLFDSSQAPPGKHTGLIWQFAPYDIKDGGPEKWDEIALDYAWRCVEAWQEYAPNMTRENVLGIYPYTPLDIARKLVNMRRGGFHVTAVTGEQLFDKRPIPELAQYRVPTVQGLYMCGASQHVHGGILAMPGYNCMQQVAKDLGIEDKLPIKTKIWWQKREEWLKRAEQKKAQKSDEGR